MSLNQEALPWLWHGVAGPKASTEPSSAPVLVHLATPAEDALTDSLVLRSQSTQLAVAWGEVIVNCVGRPCGIVEEAMRISPAALIIPLTTAALAAAVIAPSATGLPSQIKSS
jgi:hypothetical protein